jgi:hypothetical protein
MTPTTPSHTPRSRDAALRRLRRMTVAATVSGTGAVGAIAFGLAATAHSTTATAQLPATTVAAATTTSTATDVAATSSATNGQSTQTSTALSTTQTVTTASTTTTAQAVSGGSGH